MCQARGDLGPGMLSSQRFGRRTPVPYPQADMMLTVTAISAMEVVLGTVPVQYSYSI
jgi:hypothetical protein